MNDSKNIKIIQTVASGGTAVMFKAVQTSLDRIVAVKRLHSHLTDDENFTRRFILEAKAAASLDHPNIVRVIDFGLHEANYQMVMEYVDGESLKEVLERWRPVKFDIALALTHQILLGLEHAHGKGIVHRDIKPGNIMVTEHGKVKITDFGLAKLTQSAHSHTAVDSIVGTPLYMSPEQAFGESVDQRSDLFSLGTVLYELLTGKQPFASENYMGVIQNILNKKVPRVRDLTPGIPDEVEAIVAKALSRDRDDRFQTARQFREAIEGHMGVGQINAASDRLCVLLEKNTNTQVLPAPGSRHRNRSGAGRTVAAVVVLVGLIGSVAAIKFQPSLLDQLTGTLGTTPTNEIQQAAPVDPGPYPFDISEIMNDSAPSDSTNGAVASPVSASKTAPKPAPAAAAGTRDTVVIMVPILAPATGTGTAAPKPDPEPEPTKHPVVRMGYVQLDSQPASEIWLDGQYKGDTPVKIKVRSGQHGLELRHPRYETYSEKINITTGELSRRNVTLLKLKGSISLSTQDGAELYVDGVVYGTTPITMPITLDAGPHMLTIKKNGFFAWTSEVTVEPKETLPLKIRLSPRY